MNIISQADLLAFQEEVKQRFLAGEIRHPVHLCDPEQLDMLRRIFEKIGESDWLFTSYRGIFHWLLKGVPPDILMDAIIRQGTMGFCDRDRRIVSSAIVGGCLPIALGMALGVQRRQLISMVGDTLPPHVWCFLGDMAAETGGFLEATKYAGRHDLPITWVIEDNWLSTNTPTQQVWGLPDGRGMWNRIGGHPWSIAKDYGASIKWYDYQRTVPHVGVGQWVTFS